MASPEATLLGLSRLFTRLEHNLLSPSADLDTLRKDEFQRMRVGANVEYARATLSTLEKALPQIKPAERRHGIQGEVVRLRRVLKGIRGILGDVASYASGHDDSDEEEAEEGEGEWDEEELDTAYDEVDSGAHEAWDLDAHSDRHEKALEGEDEEPTLSHQTHTPTPAPTATAPYTHAASATTTATADPSSTSTLRNRNAQPAQQIQPTQSKEDALSAHRHEQEDLTSSLLALATQLKTSSQSFQSQLESEKSVLARAVDGIDRTASNMDAAERRMGLLRRMTEGKGWWGRMMLYAWIFAGWALAILIVFVGPKLRF